MKRFITSAMTALVISVSTMSFTLANPTSMDKALNETSPQRNSTDKTAPTSKIDRSLSTFVLDEYLALTTHGVVANVNTLLSANFTQTYMGDDKHQSFNRSQMMNYLKAQKGLKYNCQQRYTIIEEQTNYTLAKVTLRFPEFTRIDYVTLVRNNDGWQIDKVNTTYKK